MAGRSAMLRCAWAAALGLACLLPPAGAVPAAAPGSDVAPLAVSELAPGVFVHPGALEDWAPGNGGDVANLAFVVGSRCVAVIDTGGTPAVGRALRAAVARATPLPVCYVINTHAHPDHVLGNTAFKDAQGPAPRFVASARFARALAARAPAYLNALARDFGLTLAASDLVYPDITVERTTELDLGGRMLALRAWPTAHTDNDLTVYDPRSRTLFASDLLFVRHIPALDGSLRGWLAAMAELRQIPAALVVPGHGPAGGDGSAAMDAQHAYLDGLLRAVRAAVREGLTLPQAVERIGVPPGAPWLLAERFHRRNVTAAYAELEWEDSSPAPPAASGARIQSADDPQANPVWQKLRASLFQSRPIAPASADWLTLVLPARAEDAAIVPVAIQTRPAQSPARSIDTLYLVIDNNPSPLAAVFRFTPQSGRADIETRVRIDEYTHVRAIAQTSDGQLHMALGFVKASGGCSAPPSKDSKAAQATLGRMRLRVEPPAQPGEPQLVQLMISHPNSSGLAMDPMTRLYAPPHFVRQLTVSLAGQPVLSAELDFAISENPNFRFYVQPRGDGELRAEILDNQDLRFQSAVMLRPASP